MIFTFYLLLTPVYMLIVITLYLTIQLKIMYNIPLPPTNNSLLICYFSTPLIKNLKLIKFIFYSFKIYI